MTSDEEPLGPLWERSGVATKDQAAAYLGISPRSLDRKLADGDLDLDPVSYSGRVLLIPWRQLHALVPPPAAEPFPTTYDDTPSPSFA